MNNAWYGYITTLQHAYYKQSIPNEHKKSMVNLVWSMINYFGFSRCVLKWKKRNVESRCQGINFRQFVTNKNCKMRKKHEYTLEHWTALEHLRQPQSGLMPKGREMLYDHTMDYYMSIKTRAKMAEQGLDLSHCHQNHLGCDQIDHHNHSGCSNRNRKNHNHHGSSNRKRKNHNQLGSSNRKRKNHNHHGSSNRKRKNHNYHGSSNRKRKSTITIVLPAGSGES